jgi:hypothetical protein
MSQYLITFCELNSDRVCALHLLHPRSAKMPFQLLGNVLLWKKHADIDMEELTGTDISGGCTYLKKFMVDKITHAGELGFQKCLFRRFRGASALLIKLEGVPKDYSAQVYYKHPCTRSRDRVVLSPRQLRAQKRMRRVLN